MNTNKVKLLSICDYDKTYLERIASYLHKKMPLDFEILTFNSVEEAIDKSHDNAFEILLVGEKIYGENVSEIKTRKLFVLQEDGINIDTDHELIHKFQSMEKLVAQILEKYATDEGCKSPVKCGRNNTSLITFYSPERHSAQSISALAYSQILADKGDKVLYLNLHGFSGFEEIMNIRYDADITDFMYFALKHSEKILYKLEGMKRSIRGVDYLPPALDFADLTNIKAEDWIKVIDLILYSGDYTHIVMDMTESCQGFYEILSHSRKVYAIYNDNSIYARAAFSHFKRLLEEKERKDVLEKLMDVSISYEAVMNINSLDNLPSSEIGINVRGVMW